MGFKRKTRTYTIRFSGDSEWAGLELSATQMSVDEWLEMTGFSGTLTNRDAMHGVEIFARHVTSWNLEDEEGNPVPLPAGREERVKTVLSEDMGMLMACAGEWLNAASGVSAPLEQSSTGGQLLAEVPLPMEVLSESLPNSSEPN